MNDREFAAALRDRDAILILSHLRPDGDTLGSGAALCSALRRMGKTADRKSTRLNSSHP